MWLLQFSGFEKKKKKKRAKLPIVFYNVRSLLGKWRRLLTPRLCSNLSHSISLRLVITDTALTEFTSKTGSDSGASPIATHGSSKDRSYTDCQLGLPSSHIASRRKIDVSKLDGEESAVLWRAVNHLMPLHCNGLDFCLRRWVFWRTKYYFKLCKKELLTCELSDVGAECHLIMLLINSHRKCPSGHIAAEAAEQGGKQMEQLFTDRQQI